MAEGSQNVGPKYKGSFQGPLYLGPGPNEVPNPNTRVLTHVVILSEVKLLHQMSRSPCIYAPRLKKCRLEATFRARHNGEVGDTPRNPFT